MQYNYLFDENDTWIGANVGAVRNAIRYSTKYSGYNDATIVTLQRIFKIKFIIIDTSDPTYSFIIPNGMMVTFIINKKNIRGFITEYNNNAYTIIGVDYKTYTNIYIKNNKIQILSNFRIIRLPNDEESRKYIHFAFLLKNSINNQYDMPIDHSEYMYNVVDNKFIYSFDEIPDYLKYFIYEKSWRFLTQQERETSWLYNSVFYNYLLDCQEKVDREARLREAALQEAALREAQNGGGSPQGQTGGSFRPSFENKSKLSYFIIVDLELYPGDSIPLIKQPVIACHIRYEKIRQAFAEMFGLLYRPLEFNQSGHVSLSSTEYQLKKTK